MSNLTCPRNIILIRIFLLKQKSLTQFLCIFGSLKDEIVDIQNEIRSRFIECGEKYFRENEIELQKIELIDSEFPCSNYIETVAKERPTLGCRALVQRSLRMIGIILKELSDWKAPVRLHSLKLLWEMVLFAEKAFTCKFMEVFAALAKTCQDDDRNVVKEAQRVSFLMGQLLNYNDWITHAIKSLKKYPNNLGVLRCFNSLFAGAEFAEKKNIIEEISELISNSNMCHNFNEAYQSALIELIDQLVTIYLSKIESNHQIQSNPTCNEERYLFETLVKSISLTNAHENEKITNEAINSYEKFCRMPENRIALQGKYMQTVINSIEDLDGEHSERSERIIMLFGCIKLCGFQFEYFDALQTAIKMVLDHSTANAQIKILSGISMVIVFVLKVFLLNMKLELSIFPGIFKLELRIYEGNSIGFINRFHKNHH